MNYHLNKLMSDTYNTFGFCIAGFHGCVAAGSRYYRISPCEHLPIAKFIKIHVYLLFI